jgi:hypothetical protein
MCADDPDADDLGLGGLPAQGNAALAPLTGVAGRAKRALRNYLETFTFFAAAIPMKLNFPFWCHSNQGP